MSEFTLIQLPYMGKCRAEGLQHCRVNVNVPAWLVDCLEFKPAGWFTPVWGAFN